MVAAPPTPWAPDAGQDLWAPDAGQEDPGSLGGRARPQPVSLQSAVSAAAPLFPVRPRLSSAAPPASPSLAWRFCTSQIL